MSALRVASRLGVAAVCAACASAASAQELTWIPQYVPGPPPKNFEVAAYDHDRAVTVWMGAGQSGSRVWEWDGETWRDRGASSAVLTYDRGLAYDRARHRMVLLTRQGTWEWDGAAWRGYSSYFDWFGFAIVYDPVRGQVLRHGGGAGSTRISGMSGWNGATWQGFTTPGPLGLAYHALAFDQARGQLVVFGGDTGTGMSGSTLGYRDGTWALLATSGPSPRSGPLMVYDEAREVCVLRGGGTAAGGLRDTWLWDGSAWTELAIPAAPITAARGMVFDAARGVTVLLGRSPQNQYGPLETWTLGPPCDHVGPAIQPQPVHAVPGGTAVLAVGVTGTPVSFQWRRDGMELVDDSRISGAMTPTLTVWGLEEADVGAYDCVVRSACNVLWSSRAAVDCRPVITAPPGRIRYAGPTSLSVQVSPGASCMYQWQRDGADVVDEEGRFSGAHSPTLALLATDLSLLGTYRVRVSNDCGSVMSEAAWVTTPCPELDCTQDGNVDQDDLITWFYCVYGCGGCDFDPDFNQDGNTDQDDILMIMHVIAGGPC